MGIERIGLGLSGVVMVGLLAWNVQLNGRVAELQAVAAGAPGAMAQSGERGSDDEIVRHRPAMRERAGGGHQPRHERSGGGEAENLVVGDRPVETPAARVERRRADFGAMRSELESQTVELVEAFATQSKWEPQTTEQVLGILLDTGEAVGQVWTEAHSDEGETSHYLARKETHALQADADAEIAALVGQEAADELGEQLFTARRETMRRMH